MAISTQLFNYIVYFILLIVILCYKMIVPQNSSCFFVSAARRKNVHGHDDLIVFNVCPYWIMLYTFISTLEIFVYVLLNRQVGFSILKLKKPSMNLDPNPYNLRAIPDIPDNWLYCLEVEAMKERWLSFPWNI